MKARVTNFNIDWTHIKNLCRQTISLGESDKEPTQKWKRKLLICRHSPLRVGTITVKLEELPSFVMGHLVRHHIGVEKFVATSREDRTNVPRYKRSQVDPVEMQMDMNIEAILNISEKRLCSCADKATIRAWKKVLEAVKEYDEDIYWASVPSCVRCGGCPETFGGCSFYEKLMEGESVETQRDMIKRYDLYNKKVRK